MHLLDSRDAIAKYDKSGMLAVLESFHDQCINAKALANLFRLPASYIRQYKNIVISGMGGSAIGGEILKSYLAHDAKMPIIVNRNYLVPDFVGKDSLVIAVSYSGDTEETVSAYKDARSKGARLVVVTSGGTLLAMARKDRIPAIILPGGFQPRCAVGYLFFPLLAILSKAKVVKMRAQDIDETIAKIEELREDSIGSEVPETKNVAKQVAAGLYGKLPVIYAVPNSTDCIATRWRGELAENAKVLASQHLFPEMNHNEIVGWKNPAEVRRQAVAVILRDKDDHPRIAVRMEITRKVLLDEGAEVIEVMSIGRSRLERLFSLLYIGDFVSFYLAILNKEDPTPVERITYLKNELSRR